MAAAGTQLPPWNRGNLEEGQLVHGSVYADLLNKARVRLTEHVRLDDVWPRLRELHVLNRIQKDQLKYGKAVPQTVMELLDLIGQGPRWHFHGLMRALYQTGQAHLIPTGGLHPDVYSAGAAQEGGVHSGLSKDAQPLPQAEHGPTRPAIAPWDKINPDEAQLVSDGSYADLLNKSRASLSKHLKLDNMWSFLLQLHVIRKNDKARLTHNKPEPDRVLALFDFIESGPAWCYHALLRAMALTNQADLIPRGGLDPTEYTKGVVNEGTPPATPLLHSLPKGLWDHCKHCRNALMKAHVFSFEGDKGDDFIDVSQCLIAMRLNVLSANEAALPIKGEEILHKLDDNSAPRTIRIYGDPGDGKTTFGKNFVHNWSVNFLHQIANQGGALSLKSKCEWTTMVFLQARDVTTTVEAAIRDRLGCKKEDEDEMMVHIRQGRGIVVVVDAFDELRDPAAIKKLTQYVQECQRRGGPTIIITCRTDLCSIDAQHFDRFLTLKGYTDEEGLEYVRLYTTMCQVPQIPQTSQCHPVYAYVARHKQKLKAVLSNPLRLDIFCALAIRDELDLDEQEEFNITKLLGPLERFLLRREGMEVDKQQSKNFYRLCMHLLVQDLREFPEDLLREFNIKPAYKVFLVQSDKRNQDGILQPFFSFKHEMLLEYFVSQFIYTLSENKRMSIILAMCCDHRLRNVQKMVFQCLLQEQDTQSKLLQTVIRSMLILQYDYLELRKVKVSWQQGENIRNKFRNVFQRSRLSLHDLKHLGKKTKANFSLMDMMHSETNETKNVNATYKKIDDAFDRKHSDKLIDSNWLGCIKENGTFDHIVQLLQVCCPDLRNSIVQNTIHCLMPTDYADDYGNVSYIYPTGDTRWAEVKSRNDQLSVLAWCPHDARTALMQHTTKHPEWSEKKLSILTEHDDNHSGLWGKLDDDDWSMDALWSWILTNMHRNKAGILDIELRVKQGEMGIQRTRDKALRVHAPLAFPLPDLLSCLQDHAADLSQCKEIVVESGTARLRDLLTSVSTCTRQGLNLKLQNVHITVPEGRPMQSEPNLIRTLPAALQFDIESWTRQQMSVSLSDATPVTSLLSHLRDYSMHLSHCNCEMIVVKGGVAEVEALVSVVSKCTQVALNIALQNTHIELPQQLPTTEEPDSSTSRLGALLQNTHIELPQQLPTTEEPDSSTSRPGALLQNTHIELPQQLPTTEEPDSSTSRPGALLQNTHIELPQQLPTTEEPDSSTSRPGALLQNTHIELPQQLPTTEEPDSSTRRPGTLLQLTNWTKEQMQVSVPGTTPVTGLLSSLAKHAAHLSQCQILLEGGTAKMADLVTCVSRCTGDRLNLELQNTRIVLPSGGTPTRKDALQAEPNNWTEEQIHVSVPELLDAHIVLPQKRQAQAEGDITPVLQDDKHVKLQKWTRETVCLSVPASTPVTAVLSALVDHAVQLSQCEEIRVEGGTAELNDLVTHISRGREKGLHLHIWNTEMLIKRHGSVRKAGHTTSGDNSLRVNLEIFHQARMKLVLSTETHVDGVLSRLLEHAIHLSHFEEVVVVGGRARLVDALTCVPKCRQAGLNLTLQHSNLALPDSLRNQREENVTPGVSDALVVKLREWRKDLLLVDANVTTPVAGLLLLLHDNAEHLSSCRVEGGTAELKDLVTCVSKCRQVDLQLVLSETHVILPEKPRLQSLTDLANLLSCLSKAHWSQCAEFVVEGDTAQLEDLITCVSWCREEGLGLQVLNADIVHPGAGTETESSESLLNVDVFNQSEMKMVAAEAATQIDNVLSWLLEHAVHLSHFEEVVVVGGRARLVDALTCVPKCRQAGLNLTLQHSNLVLPDSLRNQREENVTPGVSDALVVRLCEWRKDLLLVDVPVTTPLVGFLSLLHNHAEHLPCCSVEGGTADLGHLLTCVSNCTGLKLELDCTQIVVSGQHADLNPAHQGDVPPRGTIELTAGWMLVDLDKTVSLKDHLSCILDHAVHLSQCEVIRVEGGTAELRDLVTWVSRCAQAHLTVELWDTYIVLPQKLQAHPEADITPVLKDDLHVKLQKWSREKVCLSVPASTPVTAVLSALVDHAVQLSQCEEIRVEGGTAELDDLWNCSSKCSQKELKVKLCHTSVVVLTGSVKVKRQSGLKSYLELTGVLEDEQWVTETGEEYVWPSLPHLPNVTHF